MNTITSPLMQDVDLVVVEGVDLTGRVDVALSVLVETETTDFSV